MKFCAIQSPYPYTLEQADAAVDFAVQALKQCDPSIDLILLPEYSNAPTVFPEGECIPYAEKHTKLLIDTAVETARRCNAIVAVNYAADIGGRYRNTTRVFDRRGKIAGDYYKQHLPHSEVHVKKMDDSYTFDYLPPAIVETDGLRFAFLTCYDCYFEEYIAHIAARKPDVVLVSSHQRAERPDIIEMLVKSLAFHANAFVLRASVSMGEGRQDGGCSMIASPDGKILARFGQETGLLTCEVGDPRRKYMRSNCFGGKLIRNDQYIGQGRTPWSYRAGGSMVKPNDEQMRYPRICAHRGFNTVAPENSLPAFGAAIALGAQEIFNVAARHAQHGAHHMAVAPRHAMQAAQPRAAHQVEQQRFDVVVAVVGHGYGDGPRLAAHAFEKGIALIAGLHLYAHTGKAGRTGCLEVGAVQGHAVTCAEVGHESRVAVGLSAAEMKIAVGRLDVISQTEQHEKQGDGIGSAAEPHDNTTAGSEQRMGSDVAGHPAGKIGRRHETMGRENTGPPAPKRAR